MIDIEITCRLYQASSLYAILGEKYRSRAYERAAYTLDGFGHFIEESAASGLLSSLPGIGRSVIASLDEIQMTGELDFKKRHPSDVELFLAEIRKIPGCGPQVISALKNAGVRSREALTDVLAKCVVSVPEGAKKNLLHYLQESDPDSNAFVGVPFPIALAIARELVSDLSILELHLCGDARMLKDRTRTLEFLTLESNPSLIAKLLTKHRLCLDHAKTQARSVKALVFPGIYCVVHCVPEPELAFSLLRLSSPLSHMEHISERGIGLGLQLNANGIQRSGNKASCRVKSEADIYALLDLPDIAPELRHFPLDRAVCLARQHLDQNALRGDLHMHTTWSDGIDKIEAMREGGKTRGYDYVGIADHSQYLRIAGGLDVSEAMRQIAEIDGLNKDRSKPRVLKGIEVEILKDGTLDYPQEVLSQFDLVTASVHSNTKMPREEMTKRLLTAIENPRVHVLAHPTGRLTSRPGNFFVDRCPWDFDFQQIARACGEHHVALEINAFPERLDISSELVQVALDHHAKLTISTDAHSAYHLSLIENGVHVARRGGASENDILNTMPWEDIRKYVSEKPNQRIVLSHNSSRDKARETFVVPSIQNTFAVLRKNDRYPLVVGIDLTSSEKKESGWALLNGTQVLTRKLGTDKDLVTATLDATPDVVSIDSPLALPYGRCCTRVDCECRRFGITRSCERFLMANRIGVFPCLLPSMVGLTERGIRLKHELENRGMTVIESYPGAAQDILNIPRKQRGLSRLEEGLERFGLDIHAATDSISHDELDAVTSALVGYFYLSGDYLGLGDDRENFLILPSVPQFQNTGNRHSPVIVGFAGETGTGKTTAALYLAFKYGFKYVRYSQIIAKMTGLSGDYNKAQLQKAGLELHSRVGQAEITRKLIEDFPEGRPIVIDGMRFIEDVDTLKDCFSNRFYPIFLDCPRQAIVRRLTKSPFYASYSSRELRDILSHPVEQEMLALRFHVIHQIENKESFKNLFIELDRLLRTLQT